MRCTEVCTRDTVFIPNDLPRLKRLIEIKVSIYSNKYKYIDSPTGVKLLIEGIKLYNICYCEDTKYEHVVNRKFKIPFCSIIPVNSDGRGYKSIEFIVEELKILEVNEFSIVTALLFKIICKNNYKEENIEIINSQVMEVKPSKSSLKFTEETNKKNKRKNKIPNEDSQFSGTYKNNYNFAKDYNSERLDYLIYNNLQSVKILLFLLIICLCVNKNRLR